MAAAAAPTVSADGKTITYKLKPGLKWSDGQALTSKDLVFTYTRAADTNTGSGWSAYLTNATGVADFEAGKAKTIAGFSAPDDQTFVIKQSVPDVGIVGRVSAIGILPEHTLATLPIKDFGTNAWFRKPTVGSGPFTFADYKTDQFRPRDGQPQVPRAGRGQGRLRQAGDGRCRYAGLSTARWTSRGSRPTTSRPSRDSPTSGSTR